MPASKPHSWKVGDIVMAPGDCACATLSKIVRIVGNKAFMSSAHDYTGWVFVRQIRLRKVKKGQAIKLYQRSPGGGHNIHDGTVLDSTDEQVRVIHDISQEEPGKKEWVPWRAIGIPCDPLGPACLPEDEFAFYDQLAPGTRVWAPWESSRLYSGTVTQVKGGDVHVRLDTGNCGWVLMGQIYPMLLSVDEFVYCRWKGSSTYAPGYVIGVKGEQAHIHFENGPTTCAPFASLRKETFGPRPDARPTYIARRTLWTVLMDVLCR